MSKEVFKDYSAKAIARKLAEVKEFEEKWGENELTRSWRKWCTDYEHRKREWELRQAVANSAIHSDIPCK